VAILPSCPGPSQPGSEFNRPLLALCAVLVLAWLLTIFMWLRSRRQVRTLLAEGGLELETINDINESEAFRKLVRACRSNDPVRARKGVVDWVRAVDPEAEVQTAADLAKVFPDSKLTALVAEIDNVLYSQGGGSADWRGKNLLETVEKIRKMDKKKKSKKAALAELYN